MESIDLAKGCEGLEAIRKELLARTIPEAPSAGSVAVFYDYRGRRGPTAPTIATYVGPAEAVKDLVAWTLQGEGPAHPANNISRLDEVLSSPDGSTWVIKTTRNNYYGD